MISANILFPSDYFNNDIPDEIYREEYEEVKVNEMLNPILFNFEKFKDNKELSIKGDLSHKEVPLVYRGWMLKDDEYRTLYTALINMNLKPINNPSEYNRFHMFANAYYKYETIQVNSTKLLAFKENQNINVTIINDSFDSFMLKDYVKSLKDTEFPSRISTPLTQQELNSLLKEFNRLRGELFQSGYTFKQLADLKTYNGNTNEYRLFVLNNKILSLDANSNQPLNLNKPPKSLIESLTNLDSNFYTIDFAETKDENKKWIILETGDGQVSGLPAACDIKYFYTKLIQILRPQR